MQVLFLRTKDIFNNGVFMDINKNASAGTEAEIKTISKFNYTAPLQYIKSKHQYLSRKFWVANYNLEESRQEHGRRGHLWKQIGFCLALFVFRIIGRVAR